MVNLKTGLVYAIPILFGIMLLYSFMMVYQSPRLAFQLDWNTDHNRWQITNSSDDLPFQPNDIIQKINGIEIEFFHLLTGNKPIDSKSEFRIWINTISPVLSACRQPEIQWELLRNNTIRSIVIRPAHTGIYFLKSISFISVFIISIVFFCIGIITFSRMPLNSLGTNFLLFCTSFSILLFSMGLSAIHSVNLIAVSPWFFNLTNTINLIFYFLTPVFLLHFSLLLPRKRVFLQKRSWIIWLFYLINCITAATFQLEVMFNLTPLYFILSLLMMVHAYFGYTTPVEREQMKWMAMGFLFGMGPWILLNGLPGLLFGDELMSDYVPALFTICIPLFMAFAIRKYKLLYIDVLFEGTFVYGVTLILLLVVDIGLIGMISTRYDHVFHLTPSGQGLVSILFVVLLYIPVRNQIQQGINRLFNRSPVNESKLMADFNQRVSGKSPDDVLKILEQILFETFRPQTIELETPVNPEKLKSGISPGTLCPILLWENDTFIDSADAEAAVALPLFDKEKISSILYIGYPETNKIYSHSQISLMTTLLTQANLFYTIRAAVSPTTSNRPGHG
jgi:hypothetical protein